MKKHLLAIVMLLISCLPVSSAFANSLTVGELGCDPSIIPDDAIAIVKSSYDDSTPAILFVVHGVTVDEQEISVSVMQISLDSQCTIYEDDTYGETEQSLRQQYGLSESAIIIGSYCELSIGCNNRADTEMPYYREAHTTRLRDDCIDEQFVFSTSDIIANDGTVSFDLTYSSVPNPGQIEESTIACFSFQLPDMVE